MAEHWQDAPAWDPPREKFDMSRLESSDPDGTKILVDMSSPEAILRQLEREARLAAPTVTVRESEPERERAPGPPRPTYPPEVKDSVKRAKRIRGTDSGAAGPKQHAHVRNVVRAVLALDEGAQPTADQLLGLAGVDSSDELVAIARRKAEADPLAGLEREMGDDSWCKRSHLAAALAAWIEQLEES